MDTMKRLILLTGDLATGKTTFANILSKRYNTVLFFKDSIKEVLGDTIGFANREENLKLSRATMELMYLMFEGFAKVDQNLILEANFREAELEQIQKIAAENGYEVLILVLRGNLEVLHKRYLNRIYNENRHPVHLSTTFDVYEDFCAYVENARKQKMPENCIYIEEDNFAYQTDEKLLSKLDAFMQECE